MSKYNLTDIFEQYQMGSGFTRDFDYVGMLKAGLETGVDTDIEILKKISDDFEDVNYHRENNHLQKAIDALEEGAIKEASMFFGDFHAEIKATMETFDMDIEPTVGKFMASKMEEAKEEVEEVSSSVGSRIEGLLNIPMKKKFLDAGMDLIQDLLEDDQFFIPDVIEHLAIELEKYYDGFLDQGDRLAGMEEGAMQPGEADLEAGVKGNMDAFTEGKEVDFIRALKVDANGTKLEIKSYLESLKRSGDKFDSVDDYVEDFKNYVADKSLQEHFGRFLKDYQ